jgi:Fe2+ or Zn2+ uptake regulation protein
LTEFTNLEAAVLSLVCQTDGKQPSRGHRPIFLVCRVCKAATEVSLREAGTLLQNLGFECGQIVQEVQGRCRTCVEASTAAA